jgi:uncharacterized repeat protein (TIGR03803 family)
MTLESPEITRSARPSVTLAPGWATGCSRMLGILCLILAATAIGLPAQNQQPSSPTFTTLHGFDSSDGAYPSVLVQATNGNLYGATALGGANGGGTAFKITPTGTLTTLYSFCSQSGCTDGDGVAGLVQGADGNLYGTTVYGGDSNACAQGCGTVFRLTPNGTLTTLHSFDDTDGQEPFGKLIQGSDGNFYGTTYSGGAGGYGTVFKISPNGRLTRLHSFDFSDGAYTYAGLVQGTDGNFYGTTQIGGAANLGTVFKITASGTLTTLQSFDFTDGADPWAGVVEASDGNLYGTTTSAGFDGLGTVFKISPSGMLTALQTFDFTNGESPTAALIQATDGNLYGTTEFGGFISPACADVNGAAGCGTIFKVTPSGTLTTLYSFCSQSGCTDGTVPYAAVIQDTNGIFYGTSLEGGASSACSGGCGTVFSLSVGLGPFVETQHTSGKVGALVKILGTNLTGATGVKFNGVAAVYKVVSRTLISATVPSDATTGFVTVTTPSGKLKSNVKFRVRR